MKILKDGKKLTHKFICPRCCCEFEAYVPEYTYNVKKSWTGKSYYSMKDITYKDEIRYKCECKTCCPQCHEQCIERLETTSLEDANKFLIGENYENE